MVNQKVQPALYRCGLDCILLSVLQFRRRRARHSNEHRKIEVSDRPQFHNAQRAAQTGFLRSFLSPKIAVSFNLHGFHFAHSRLNFKGNSLEAPTNQPKAGA